MTPTPYTAAAVCLMWRLSSSSHTLSKAERVLAPAAIGVAAAPGRWGGPRLTCSKDTAQATSRAPGSLLFYRAGRSVDPGPQEFPDPLGGLGRFGGAQQELIDGRQQTVR